MKSIKKDCYFILKRETDFLLSLFLILVLSPTLLVLLLITIIDSNGSPIFRQKRLGKNQKVFVIIKFRSMKRSSPNKGSEYLTEEESQKFTTRWGRFIRKTSLDELPQLFNIFTGSMSFIGPRPGLTEDGEPELVKYRLSYLPSAYDVKPGLSGYSQVMLKRDHNVKERARYDSFYVQHASVTMDMMTFVKSFTVIVNNKTN
jgi:lipopolysaccharide/colanic/teichoic acid biosynthesis glycosyltransferase